MSLQDAESITSADVKFLSTAHFAGEKLCGWLVVIDVFHGVAHDVATRMRNFVIAVVPNLHSVQCNLAETPGVDMDMVCRILCEAQQEHFRWANEVANGVAAAPPVNFSEILGKVQAHRVSSLCPLPSLWHSMVNAGAPTRPGGRPPSGQARLPPVKDPIRLAT